MFRARVRAACLLAIVGTGTAAAQPPATRSAPPTRTAPATEPWRIIIPPQATLVFARDGALIGELGSEKRLNVSIRSLPKYVGQAFV
ncbi:MAG: hypothetical protein MUE41_19105, partial [Gemmatimonadaceae bacterium]|nr:hypothetical protein [Gemmatimonadaceae bacterium]